MPSTSSEPSPATREHGGGDDVFPARVGSIGILVVTALFVLTQLYAAIPLLGPVGAELGGDATFALSTGFSLCYAVGFLLWGPIADRYGRKRILVIGLSCLVVTTLACTFAGSIPVLAILRGTQGLAAASFAPVALAYLSEAVPPKYRPTAIGAMSAAFLVAGIFGQVMAQAVSLHFDWPWMFGSCGLVLAACLAATVFVVREPSRSESSGNLRHQFSAIGRAAIKPTVLWLCAAHITLLLSFVAMYTGLGPHLNTFGLGTEQVLWLRLIGLPGMFASLLTGRLSHRLTTAGVARTGYLLAACGLALEALTAGSLASIAASSLVFVTGVALAIPSMITLFGQAAAPQRAGGMAINGLVLFTGASIGPLIAATGIPFPALLLVLTTLLALASVSVTISARHAAQGTHP